MDEVLGEAQVAERNGQANGDTEKITSITYIRKRKNETGKVSSLSGEKLAHDGFKQAENRLSQRETSRDALKAGREKTATAVGNQAKTERERIVQGESVPEYETHGRRKRETMVGKTDDGVGKGAKDKVGERQGI